MDSSQKSDITAISLADVKCAKCGYWLRGLDVQGPCPECGTFIALSLNQRLIFNNRDHKVRCQRGLTLWIMGLVVLGYLLYFRRSIWDANYALRLGSFILLSAGTWLASVDVFETPLITGNPLPVYAFIRSRWLRFILRSCSLLLAIATVCAMASPYLRGAPSLMYVVRLFLLSAIAANLTCLLVLPIYMWVLTDAWVQSLNENTEPH